MADISQIVPLKNSLAQRQTTSSIVETVMSQIQAIPNHSTLKNDMELLLYACNIVEHLGTKKLDKKEIVLEAFVKLFCLDSQEQTQVKSSIDFLWNNKQIKKLSKSNLLLKSVIAWLKKKLL